MSCAMLLSVSPATVVYDLPTRMESGGARSREGWSTLSAQTVSQLASKSLATDSKVSPAATRYLQRSTATTTQRSSAGPPRPRSVKHRLARYPPSVRPGRHDHVATTRATDESPARSEVVRLVPPVSSCPGASGVDAAMVSSSYGFAASPTSWKARGAARGVEKTAAGMGERKAGVGATARTSSARQCWPEESGGKAPESTASRHT
mmetsp:Transcript_46856/g.124688  ORF Transcript_46856/g.124688 Transcript_46856/m.124688 type:complete len:206 (-) Transcript_46856:1295-1912(-)